MKQKKKPFFLGGIKRQKNSHRINEIGYFIIRRTKGRSDVKKRQKSESDRRKSFFFWMEQTQLSAEGSCRISDRPDQIGRENYTKWDLQRLCCRKSACVTNSNSVTGKVWKSKVEAVLWSAWWQSDTSLEKLRKSFPKKFSVRKRKCGKFGESPE